MTDRTGRVPRRPGPTLAERSADSRLSSAPRRHCWVTGPDESPGPWPGLVVEWRRQGGDWIARTIYVVSEQEPPPVVVEQWLRLEQLRPAL